MATSGYTDVKVTDYNTLRFLWTLEEQNELGNYSDIRWQLILYSGTYGEILSSAGKNCFVTVDGIDAATSTVGIAIDNNSSKVLLSSTKRIYHNADGTKVFSYSFGVDFSIVWGGQQLGWARGSGTGILPDIYHKATIHRAPYFTDEENPTVYFTTTARALKKLEIGISLSNGTYMEIPYREIDTASTSYTFEFTDYERKFLRERSPNSVQLPLTFYARSTLMNDEQLLSGMSSMMTIVNSAPTINTTSIKDVNSITTALTGNENIFVLNASRVEANMTASFFKETKVVDDSYKIQCGSKTIKSTLGYFPEVESGSIVFTIKDSRNLITTKTVTAASVIEYKKPTISFIYTQPDATATTLTGTVSGTFWHGSFGVSNNTFNLQYRYRIGNGDYTNWTNLYAIPTEGTYSTGFTIPGMDYRNAYTVQMRVIDSIYTVESSEVNVLVKPVFDWSKSDFNFNVPITMNGETVLRHNASANNTVLSASGGHIYIRPQGSEDTTGETVINPDGSVVFGGEVDLSATMSDYVIETGTASMGTNGTWYWSKWKSGRAECYGVRNFGNMAISTAWGSLYCSAAYTQSLPSGLFKAAPEYVNPVVVGTTQGACEVWRDSSTTTDSATQITNIILVRPTSYNAQQVKIGFNVIGRWK